MGLLLHDGRWKGHVWRQGDPPGSRSFLACPTGAANEHVRQQRCTNKGMIAENSDPARRGVWITAPGKPPRTAWLRAKEILELVVERGDVSISCGPKANCSHKDCNVSYSLLFWKFVIRKSGPSKLCRTNVWVWRIRVHHQWWTVVAVEVPCSHLPSREPNVKKVMVDGLQIQHQCTSLIVQAEVFISLGGPKPIVSMMGVHWPSYSPLRQNSSEWGIFDPGLLKTARLRLS